MTNLVAVARRLRDRCARACADGKNFLARREEGASLVEYALLVGLLALATIAALTFVANNFSNAFNSIGNTLNNHTQPN